MAVETKFYVDVFDEVFPVVRDKGTQQIIFWVESRSLSEGKKVWLLQRMCELLNGEMDRSDSRLCP